MTSSPHHPSSAESQRQGRIWRAVRQALLMIAAQIEKEYGMTRKAASKLQSEGDGHLLDDS